MPHMASNIDDVTMTSVPTKVIHHHGGICTFISAVYWEPVMGNIAMLQYTTMGFQHKIHNM